MVIVHLIGYFQPQFGYKEYYLARNQVKIGHEVHVITSDRMYPFPKFETIANKIGVDTDRIIGPGHSKLDGIYVHRLPVVFEFYNAIIVKGVYKLLKEIGPDIVHAYEPDQLVPVFGALYKKKGHYKFLVDHQQFRVPATIFGKIYYYSLTKYLSRYMFQKADKIIFTTDASATFAKEHIGFDSKKVIRIPLGYDPEIFKYDKNSRQQVRKKLNIPGSKLVLISAGRIERKKKYENILKAINKLRYYKNVLFLLVGDGDNAYIDELNRYSSNNGLRGSFLHLHMIPPRELYKYYSAADFGIWPELPSITIIEALGCELPVILPELDTVSHLSRLGAGPTFKQGSSAALSVVLSQILASRKEIDKYKQKIKKYILSEYNYLNIVKKLFQSV